MAHDRIWGLGNKQHLGLSQLCRYIYLKIEVSGTGLARGRHAQVVTSWQAAYEDRTNRIYEDQEVSQGVLRRSESVLSRCEDQQNFNALLFCCRNAKNRNFFPENQNLLTNSSWQMIVRICYPWSLILYFQLREASPVQNGWIFGKVPNGRWPPLPHFWKIMLQIFSKIHDRSTPL